MNKTVSDTKVMVMGIISAVCCYEGWGAVVGLVLSIITLKLAKTYLAENDGMLSKKAKAGYICGKVALIVSIVALAISVIASIVMGGIYGAALIGSMN